MSSHEHFQLKEQCIILEENILKHTWLHFWKRTFLSLLSKRYLVQGEKANSLSTVLAGSVLQFIIYLYKVSSNTSAQNDFQKAQGFNTPG